MIRILVLAVLLGTSGCTKTQDNSEIVNTENTSDRCQDDFDNDGDGNKDCADADCRDFVFCHTADSASLDTATGADTHSEGVDTAETDSRAGTDDNDTEDTDDTNGDTDSDYESDADSNPEFDTDDDTASSIETDSETDSNHRADTETGLADDSDTIETDTGSESTCVEECPMDSDYVVCGADDQLLGCGYLDDDPCLDFGPIEQCPSRCWSNECVDCVVFNDCEDPIREDCDFNSHTCIPDDTWAFATISIGGDEPFTTDLIFKGTNAFNAEFETGGGQFTSVSSRTIVSLSIDNTAVPGEQVCIDDSPATLVMTFYDDDHSARFEGAYTPSGEGHLTMDELSLAHGGVISGNIQMPLAGGNDTEPIPANIDFTFFARFAE
jgi:hypothetical protein